MEGERYFISPRMKKNDSSQGIETSRNFYNIEHRSGADMITFNRLVI